jgi:hypothetical protein
MEFSELKCVHGERYQLGGLRYDLAVYSVNGAFYAAWWCEVCLIREQTPQFVAQALAHQAAIESMESHHVAAHAGRECGG